MKHLLSITLFCIGIFVFATPNTTYKCSVDFSFSGKDSTKGKTGQNKPHNPHNPIYIPSIVIQAF